MTAFQKIIKYCATALALFLAVSIIGGIIGGLASLSGIFSSYKDEEYIGEMNVFSVDEKVSALEIDTNFADIEIVSGEDFKVESNIKELYISSSNGRLKVLEKRKDFKISSKALPVIRITVPENTVFEQAEILTGAGDIFIDRLETASLLFEIGAGKTEINNLTASFKSEIDGGAGEITVHGGFLNNLDMDMGVGELNLTSELKGKCEFDMGVGEANINIIGSKEDYSLSLDKGIGEVTFDGVSLKDGDSIEGGINTIEIDSGVGAVNVVFKPAA